MFIYEPIKGETPLEDISGIKLRLPSYTRQIINELEARNIAQAFLKYFAGRLRKNAADFSYSWMLKLHEEMFGDVWEWAGKQRKTDYNIGSPAYRISTDMAALIKDLEAWQLSEMPFIEQAAKLHHRAVQIHPFANGNGRWARFLTNIWLKKQQQRIIEWPVTVDQESPIRESYIQALKQADILNMQPLIEMHACYQIRI
jgi:Fic-DOC domain mobile mystery protein B